MPVHWWIAKNERNGWNPPEEWRLGVAYEGMSFELSLGPLRSTFAELALRETLTSCASKPPHESGCVQTVTSEASVRSLHVCCGKEPPPEVSRTLGNKTERED